MVPLLPLPPRPSWLPGPIIGAPMAGGVSTPALVAAVTRAGGLGFLAAGYLDVAELGAQIDTVRGLGVGHFGVNLFVPPTDQPDPLELERFAGEIRDADPRHTPVGALHHDDDQWQAKLALLLATHVPIASFTFGLPSREQIAVLQDAGTVVIATVTSPDEARAADAAGVDALVVQSAEAGGHRGTFRADAAGDQRPLPDLLVALAELTDLPLIGAGGIDSSDAVAEVLAAGACAVQVGTALLLSDEAGTPALHRAALTDHRFSQTVVTRAHTGRPARSLANELSTRLDPLAPAGYPQVRQLWSPGRAAALAAGDPQWVSLWAGTRWQGARSGPAAAIVQRLQAPWVSITRAQLTDAAEYAACREQSIREAYAHFMPQAFFDARQSEFDAYVAEYVDDLRARDAALAAGVQPFRELWLARTPSGQVVGIATVAAGPADWEAALDVPAPAVRRELAQLYTLPQAYGTGLGRRLLDAALPQAGSAYLWVMSDNPRAITFYERNGFVTDGVRTPAGDSWFNKSMTRMVRH